MTSDLAELEPMLARLRAGEREALAELFSLYRPQLRRMVELRLDPRVGTRVAASDVLQEAFLDDMYARLSKSALLFGDADLSRRAQARSEEIRRDASRPGLGGPEGGPPGPE